MEVVTVRPGRWVQAVVVLAVLSGLVSCSDGGDGSDAALRGLMADLGDEPQAARDFLTATSGAKAEKDARRAGAPRSDRVDWLLADADLGEAAVDAAAAVILAATTEELRARRAARQVSTILEQTLHAGAVEAGLRGAVGEALAANLPAVYDDLASLTARPEKWSASPERAVLIEVGKDPDGHDALVAALEKEVRGRLAHVPQRRDPVRAGKAIGGPFARLVGAVTRGAGEAADAYDRGEVFGAGYDLVATLMWSWAEPRIPDVETRTALANGVADLVTEELR